MKDLKEFINDNQKISIRRQCELLDIPRSSLYYEPVEESIENLEIMRLMDQKNILHPTYGAKQMQDYLRLQEGYIVNIKRVRRLLRKMGIEAIYPKRNLSRLGLAKYIHPYLLRNLAITKPNQVWAIDITYVPMERGFMYKTAIIDVYSRFVVGWDLHNSLDAINSLNVLKKAIASYGKPEIINSDQGSQFTCALWVDYLNQEQIRISMDGKGRAIDNIYIERYWRTYKQDFVYLNPCDDGAELYAGTAEFVRHYNMEKAHQGINRVVPFTLYTPAA